MDGQVGFAFGEFMGILRAERNIERRKKIIAGLLQNFTKEQLKEYVEATEIVEKRYEDLRR